MDNGEEPQQSKKREGVEDCEVLRVDVEADILRGRAVLGTAHYQTRALVSRHASLLLCVAQPLLPPETANLCMRLIFFYRNIYSIGAFTGYLSCSSTCASAALTSTALELLSPGKLAARTSLS